MELAQRKKWQLERRMKSLQDEFERWRDVSEAGQPFQKHHTQVRAFFEVLTASRHAVQGVIREDAISARDAREISKVALGIFRIWEFLRSKLVQRREQELLPFLEMADEYAWLCYAPAYEKGFKEPPLVFLNGGYSPFVLVRDERFQAEVVPQELIRDRTLLEAMSSLPFPVIGVPWYQVTGLSELSVLAHEVGHSMEADLRLDGELDGLISEAVGEDRRERWLDWRSEVFADLWGCLAGGPAFAAALADFLSGEDPGPVGVGFPYPPPPVRFRLNLAFLRFLGFDAAARGLAAAWGETYREAGGDDGFMKDCEAVAEDLLKSPLPELGELEALPFRFTEAQEVQARDIAKEVLGRGEVRQGYELRTLAAAYRYAYDDLAAAGRQDESALLERIQEAMTQSIKDDLRLRERTGRGAVRGNAWLRAQSADWLNQLKKG